MSGTEWDINGDRDIPADDLRDTGSPHLKWKLVPAEEKKHLSVRIPKSLMQTIEQDLFARTAPTSKAQVVVEALYRAYPDAYPDANTTTPPTDTTPAGPQQA